MPKREIRPRDDTNSWFWLDEANREPNLVLFVHGYGGHAEGTWQRFPYLIRERDQGFDAFEVASFGYQTGRVRNFQGVSQIAGGLLSFIDAYADANERVFIVAHSLGGLVTRRFLVNTFNKTSERQFFEKVRQVHFIGVPHLGAGHTGVLQRLKGVIGLFNELVVEISEDSPALLKTLDSWGEVVELARGQGVPLPSITNYVGNRDVLAPLERQIGKHMEAEAVREISGDHFRIAKPLDTNDPVFRLVRERILADAAPAHPTSASEDAQIAFGSDDHQPSRRGTPVFDQRGQKVQYQYNAAGDINFGAVESRAELLAELEKLLGEVQRAGETGTLSEDAVVDAEHNVKKAMIEAKKEEPDKTALRDRLTAARDVIKGAAENVTELAGLALALQKAAELVMKLL